MASRENVQLHLPYMTVNQIQSNFDEGVLSCAVFIDLKKALKLLTISLYCKHYIIMA